MANRKYHKKATQKQLTALELISRGETPRQAMLKAGYSKEAAEHPKQVLYKSQAITSILDKVRLEMKSEGLTTAYIVSKYKQLAEATDGVYYQDMKVADEPAHKIQLEAIRDLAKLWGVDKTKEDPNLKRKITLEEFIYSDNKLSNSKESQAADQTQEINEAI